MPKHLHEIRDPIHVFVRLDTDERSVVDSAPFQRLRHIHQLATTFLIYPGATHKRFEHCLGVMELAGRVFDVVTHPYNIHEDIRRVIPQITDPKQLGYWRSCLRMAALCHDIGHLPFSHAAEKELLPEEWDHERLSRELILSPEMRNLFNAMTPPLRAEDVVKLAVGPEEANDLSFSTWETILAEIIVGDAFGVDRMDYLLRDSHHAGVPYGRFDHHRLIDTLRILPSPPAQGDSLSQGDPVAQESGAPTIGVQGNVPQDAPAQTSSTAVAANQSGVAPPPVVNPAQHSHPSYIQYPREPALGIEEGGLHSAAALMVARFFMYSQLYFHPIRRAYDIHLKDFLKDWLSGGQFPTDANRHLEVTDNEVTSALLHASRTPAAPGHDAARRLMCRDHFRLLYQRHPEDVAINPEAGEAIFSAACEEFGEERVRRDRYSQRSGAPDFPVLTKDGRIASSLAMSQTLTQLEAVSIDFVFVDKAILNKAQDWLRENRLAIITPTEGPDDE